MSVLHDTLPPSIAGSVPTITPPLAHPTACPSWCKSRTHRMGHSFGPTGTWHWSPQYTVGNPRPWVDGQDVIVSAELVVADEGDQLGETSLYVQGAADIDLSPAEADIFIANMAAFLDTLRVLRRQMDGTRMSHAPDQAAAA